MKQQSKNIQRQLQTQQSTSISHVQRTVLHLAARFSSAKIVRLLIEAGADINALDSDQCSPLHHAFQGNPAVMPILVKAGGTVKVCVCDAVNFCVCPRILK